MKLLVPLLGLALSFSTISVAQNVGIGSTGALPHSSAMLDISSTNSGFLMPRMTTAERDAIASPAVGLQVFNTTTGTVSTYSGSSWTEAKRNNYVLVKSLADLPTPVGTEITLDGNTLYEINGTVNISPNYINVNGACIKGSFAEKDIIASSVAGAVLRSTNHHVFLDKFTVTALSGATTAYDFSDATSDKICIIFPGTAVVDFFTPSLGVGKISGFRLVAIQQNYWRCQSGLKIGGNMSRLLFLSNYMTGITLGAGLQFLSDLNATMLDIASNQFTTTGVPGILRSGGTVNTGRLHSNYFTETANPISGFTKKDPSWWMSNNNAISDSRILGQMYLATPTNNASVATNTFQVVAGTYSAEANIERMTQSNARLTYTGSQSQVLNFVVSLSVNALSNTSGEVLEFELRKNGASLLETRQKVAIKGSTDFVNLSITGITPCNTGDYLEVWARNTTSTAAWRVEKLIFTVL